jgi:ribosomal protein L37AE/L43A
MGGQVAMKRECPSCGPEGQLRHSEGLFVCMTCGWELGKVRAHERHDRRYKRVLRRLDKIGSRLAGVR